MKARRSHLSPKVQHRLKTKTPERLGSTNKEHLCGSCLQLHAGNLLGDFENAKQSQGSQHADTKGCSWFDHVPDHLKNTADNHLKKKAAGKVITSVSARHFQFSFTHSSSRVKATKLTPKSKQLKEEWK